VNTAVGAGVCTAWCADHPGLAIAVICLGFNLFGDALRDALDPTTRKR
jgi:peptide/nickel transport system permease protein